MKRWFFLPDMAIQQSMQDRVATTKTGKRAIFYHTRKAGTRRLRLRARLHVPETACSVASYPMHPLLPP
ncbi:MAG TPA: hypothetical protein VK395_25870 [Gemmataceae bacterium]|nr:hypothetical protein [Gemmataceae bacterium]